MLILAHTGITLGAAAVIASTAKNRRLIPKSWLSPFSALSGYLDIRLLLVGSVLPDIIDKPVGLYFFRESLGSGRIYAHTLLFLVLITIAGILLYRLRHQVWMLTLAVGTLMHLILDQMWSAPNTLFWPLLGFEFDKTDVTGWLSGILDKLQTNPEVYIPEIIGFMILLLFGLMLIFRKQMPEFIKNGRIQ
jgi:inner membrane protein